MTGVVTKRHDLGSERWHEFDIDRLFTTPEFLNGAADLRPGDLVSARVEHADAYDLWARLESAS